MKSAPFKLILLAGSVFLATTISSCGDKAKETTTSSTGRDSASVQEAIVYVNSDSLLNQYQYFKDLQTKLQTKTRAAEADMQSKGQAFQREVAQYQQQQQTMAADQRAATEQRLARKQQELQAYQQNAGAALQNEQGAEQEKLYDRVAGYLKGYAKQKGYKMVLTYSKGNSAILFADEKLDVTKEVIKGLNEEYNKKK